MDPILSVGSSFAYGQIQVFPNRVEYHKRTQHGSIPIGEASISVEGFALRTIKVHGKSQTFEVENASKGDYDKLLETISRLQAGEELSCTKFDLGYTATHALKREGHTRRSTHGYPC